MEKVIHTKMIDIVEGLADRADTVKDTWLTLMRINHGLGV